MGSQCYRDQTEPEDRRDNIQILHINPEEITKYEKAMNLEQIGNTKKEPPDEIVDVGEVVHGDSESHSLAEDYIIEDSESKSLQTVDLGKPIVRDHLANPDTMLTESKHQITFTSIQAVNEYKPDSIIPRWVILLISFLFCFACLTVMWMKVVDKSNEMRNNDSFSKCKSCYNVASANIGEDIYFGHCACYINDSGDTCNRDSHDDVFVTCTSQGVTDIFSHPYGSTLNDGCSYTPSLTNLDADGGWLHAKGHGHLSFSFYIVASMISIAVLFIGIMVIWVYVKDVDEGLEEDCAPCLPESIRDRIHCFENGSSAVAFFVWIVTFTLTVELFSIEEKSISGTPCYQVDVSTTLFDLMDVGGLLLFITLVVFMVYSMIFYVLLYFDEDYGLKGRFTSFYFCEAFVSMLSIMIAVSLLFITVIYLIASFQVNSEWQLIFFLAGGGTCLLCICFTPGCLLGLANCEHTRYDSDVETPIPETGI